MRSEADKVVVVDLDGTLAEYEGWTGKFEPIGAPISDVNGWSAGDFMLALQRRGFRTIVYSSRGDVDEINDWLNEHEIPCDVVNTSLTNFPGESGKPPAIAYVDDRAVRFAGDYRSALVRVIQLAGKGGARLILGPSPSPAEAGSGEGSKAENAETAGNGQRAKGKGATATAGTAGKGQRASAVAKAMADKMGNGVTATAEDGNGEPIDLELSPGGEATLLAHEIADIADLLQTELGDNARMVVRSLCQRLDQVRGRLGQLGERIVELQHDRDHWRELYERLDDEDVFSDGG